jgi:hypothetical protein
MIKSINQLTNYFKNQIFKIYFNYTYNKIVYTIPNSKQKKINNKRVKKLSDDLMKKGLIEYDIRTKKKKIDHYEKILKKKETPYYFKNNPTRSNITIHQKGSLVEDILSDKNLTNIIKNYLGKDAKLDTISLDTTKLNSHSNSISEQWHYDNVGNRIKMFFFLNSTKLINTEFIEGTNRIKHKKFNTLETRISEEEINRIYKKKIFCPSRSKAIIFDTNAYHRGNYAKKNFEYNLGKIEYRRILKFEFSNKKISDKFFGKTDIIGPRFTFFSSNFNFKKCPIIDKHYLTKIDNIYFYDQGCFKNFN